VYVHLVPSATASDEASVGLALSTPRIGTYVAACSGDMTKAVALYGWNARLSAALMLPAHFAEVTTRNAVDEALTKVYGSRWPWDQTLLRSLPNPTKGYSPRKNLMDVARREMTTGKVIAELKFMFWQTIFTARHDGRLWTPHIAACFPNTAMQPKALRTRIYDDLEVIRQLRNRMAHHEPIFRRNAGTELIRMTELIDMRSRPTGDWVKAMEDVTAVLLERP